MPVDLKKLHDTQSLLLSGDGQLPTTEERQQAKR